MLDAIGIESSASEESSGVESDFSDFSEFQQSFASDYDQLTLYIRVIIFTDIP